MLNQRLDLIDRHCRDFSKLADEKQKLEDNLKNLAYMQMLEQQKYHMMQSSTSNPDFRQPPLTNQDLLVEPSPVAGDSFARMHETIQPRESAVRETRVRPMTDRPPLKEVQKKLTDEYNREMEALDQHCQEDGCYGAFDDNSYLAMV